MDNRKVKTTRSSYFLSQNFRNESEGVKECSAGFQPAKGLLQNKELILIHMPARCRRYDFFAASQPLRGVLRQKLGLGTDPCGNRLAFG